MSFTITFLNIFVICLHNCREVLQALSILVNHTAKSYQLLQIMSHTINYNLYNALQLTGSATYLVSVTSCLRYFYMYISIKFCIIYKWNAMITRNTNLITWIKTFLPLSRNILNALSKSPTCHTTLYQQTGLQ